jgi:competence protein ComEC
LPQSEGMDHPFRGQGGLYVLLAAHYAGFFLALAAGPAGASVPALLVPLAAGAMACRVRAFAAACILAALCGGMAAQRLPAVDGAAVRPCLEDEVVLKGTVQRVRCTDGGWSGTVEGATVGRIGRRDGVPLGPVLLHVREPDREVAFPAELRAIGRLRPLHGFGNPGEIPAEWAGMAQGARYAFFTDGRRSAFRTEAPGEGSSAGLFERARRRTNDWVKRRCGTTDGALYLLSLATGETPPGSHPMVALLRRTGLAHLLAISGVNVAVFYLIALALLRLVVWTVRRRHGTPDLNLLASVLSLPACWAYVFLAGSPAPAVRSAGMITLSVLAWRRFGVRATGAAWTAMLLLTLVRSPLEIFSPSLLLTYGATFFLIANGGALLPGPGNGWKGAAVRRGRDALVASTVAFCGTLPISVAFFHTVPSGAILWNLLFGPILGTAGVVGACAAVAGGVFGLDALGPPVRLAAAGLTRALELLALCSGSGAGCFPVPPAGVAAPAVALGAAVAGTILLLRRGRRAWPVPVAAAVLFLGWLHLPYLALPGREFRLTALNVGKGASHLVSFAGGGHMLVDCGSGQRGNAGERAVVPLLRSRGIRKIDILVLTHPHEDHYGGASAVLSAVEVGEVWLPDGIPKEAFGPAVAGWPGRFRSVRAGFGERFGGAEIVVRAPRPDAAPRAANAGSIVLELRFGILSVWLPGDVEEGPAAWGAATAQPGEQRVLFLPHHGSPKADPAGWEAFCRPAAVVAQNTICFTGENLVLSAQRFLLENGAFTVRSDGRRVTFGQWDADRGWSVLWRLT